VGRWRANGELAAPVSHAILRVSIAASTRAARDLVRRILDVRAAAGRPTPEERDPRIDLEHNVMAMR